MDDLRHILSFMYRPLTDSDDRIIVWQSATDLNDSLNMSALVGRAGRETLFSSLVEEEHIVVGDNGRCERDAQRCATQLYSRFGGAMRSDFSAERPARPIYYFDGTGGSLGKGIAHAELGSADFTGGCKQSRATLCPLNLYSGNDHALPLRANVAMTMDSFNAMTASGENRAWRWIDV